MSRLALLTEEWLEGFLLVHRWKYQGGGGRKENGSSYLFKPWSCYTAWPGQRLKATVDHGLELEGSPLPQAGSGLPNIWKLATKLEAHGIFGDRDASS